MAIGQTTTTVVDPAIATFYDGTLLVRAIPLLVHNKFGQERPIDQKSGNTAKFRRYESLPVATAPLVEGVTPSALQISKTDVTETLKQYGAYVEYTDVVTYTNQDPVLTEIATVLGEHAGNSLDIIYRDKLLATTSVYRSAGVATRILVADHAVAADFDRINRVFKNANAKYFDPNIIKASTGVGTTPQRPCYYVIVHPDVEYDIDNTTNFPGFTAVANYPSPSSALPGEFGAYKNFRFISTTNAKIEADQGATATTVYKYTTANTASDVYQGLVFARDAYGITPLSGHALENVVTSLAPSKSDPLGQRGTSGWKAMTGLCLLNETFMLRYECLASV